MSAPSKNNPEMTQEPMSVLICGVRRSKRATDPGTPEPVAVTTDGRLLVRATVVMKTGVLT